MAMIVEGLREISRKYMYNWLHLECYIKEEVEQGKREFRILFQDPNTVTIDKDGKTADFELL